MELNLHKILCEVIEEYMDISYDDIKSGHHSMPIVYQCAFSDRVKKIFENGFSREYAFFCVPIIYCAIQRKCGI